MESVRINKFISSTGFCSRREADKLVEQKKVTINGQIAVMGSQVNASDVVKVGDTLIEIQSKKDVYIILNKPTGITCTTELKIKDNIIDYVNHSERIFPVGRLDKPSQGLIILTSDGDIVNKILRAGNFHEKEYIVTVNKPITTEFIKGMSSGVPILDTITRKCIVQQINRFTFRIILTQGLNRQIRRMCEYFSYEVQKLERIRIMNLTLDNLPLGKWRDLTSIELNELMKLVDKSVKN
ncbi:MAG: 23S rRNA pseudouridine(2604) synthase RluF [Flavobacteriales bacterium]|nr:23S rRNA pseudouridine(2604) synthase RluF [Flavobacteriales bacterium]